MVNYPKPASIQTPSEIRQWFFENGISVTEWARVNGFQRAVVYAALEGRTRGCRGQSHAVAVALGLKKRPNESSRPANTINQNQI